MLLTFPPMNNQVAIPTTTVNSNILVTLTPPSTITTKAISSASVMVSINPAPAISVAATGQDAIFETRLNAMKMPFSNWGVRWKKSFQQIILRVSHEEKMIEDI